MLPVSLCFNYSTLSYNRPSSTAHNPSTYGTYLTHLLVSRIDKNVTYLTLLQYIDLLAAHPGGQAAVTIHVYVRVA